MPIAVNLTVGMMNILERHCIGVIGCTIMAQVQITMLQTLAIIGAELCAETVGKVVQLVEVHVPIMVGYYIGFSLLYYGMSFDEVFVISLM